MPATKLLSVGLPYQAPRSPARHGLTFVLALITSYGILTMALDGNSIVVVSDTCLCGETFFTKRGSNSLESWR